MTAYRLIRTRLRDGIWQGVVTGDSADAPAPDIEVTHFDRPLSDVSIAPADIPGRWILEIPIPVAALSDGVQTFLVLDRVTGERLGDFCLVAGDALAADIRAEMGLLRAELDMLKRAFRRHCTEAG